MTHHEGLLLDFGGVVTTDFFAACGGHDGCYNFLFIVKAGPAGGRLRRPSSAGGAGLVGGRGGG